MKWARILFLCGVVGIVFCKGEVSLKSLELIGNAQVSALGGVSSVVPGEYNPAAMGLIKGSKVLGLTYAQHIVGMRYGYLSYVQDITKNDWIGISVYSYNSGEIEGRDEDKNLVDNWDAADILLRLSYARVFEKLRRHFTCGVSLTYIRSRIANVSTNVLCSDIGLTYSLTNKLKLGVVLKNIGSRVRYLEETEELPSSIKCGLSYRGDRFLILTEVVKSVDRVDVYVRSGVEVNLFDLLRLRFGYDGQKDDLNSLTGGLGLKIKGVGIDFVSVDYAYSPYGELKDSHKYSLSFKF